MSARSVSILVLCGFLAVGVAACDRADPKTAPAPTPTSTQSAVATPTTPSGNQPVRESTGATRAPNCPVTAATLLTALQKKYPGHALPKGQTLRNVQCYQDYAIGGRFTPGFDRDIQTFKYSSGSWKSFTGGSGGYCEGVPAGVRSHFRSVGYPGCA